jgi:hypothetical protein
MASDPNAPPPTRFEPDAGMAADAVAIAEDLVAFARDKFSLTLDYSEASISLLEQMAVALDRSRKPGQTQNDPKVAQQFGPLFGFYIGEVYRRNFGCTWGWITVLGSKRMPGVQTDQGGQWWPVNKATKRLLGDPTENLAYYWQVVCRPKEPDASA